MTNPQPHPHLVRLPISRAALGHRFERVFSAIRYAADVFSGGTCRVQAVYEGGQRVAYEFIFRDGLTAMRMRLYHASLVQGRPLPLKEWC